jgi:hypothetical protein
VITDWSTEPRSGPGTRVDSIVRYGAFIRGIALDATNRAMPTAATESVLVEPRDQRNPFAFHRSNSA